MLAPSLPMLRLLIKTCGTIIKIKFLKFNMNKENASKLWKMIQEAGDYLGG